MPEDDPTNVKVAVRCRPFNKREIERNAAFCLEMSGPNTVIVNPRTNEKKTFIFDYSYFTDVKQEVVYGDLGAPLLSKAFSGYNGTIFAYGQTGSGKSHSMMGDADAGLPGIIPQMNERMFERIREDLEAEKGVQYLVTVSYLEIYNEVVHDLLNPSGKDLKIREHPTLGIYVDKLAELVVKSDSDIKRLINQGNKVRQVAATNMNEHSSRSHSVFTIKLEQRRVEGDTTRNLRAKINLVDLAGSERAESTGATGARLKEGAAINKSLSALGNVINALADPHKSGGFVPYRDSKLTRILQESLGGNSITVMLAALSPADINYDETLSTLLYANRAKDIKNKSKVNEDEQTRMVRELRQEIDRLRKMVGGPAGSAGAASQAAEVDKMQEMQRKMEELELAKRQTWEERERISRMFEEERKKNLQQRGLTQWVMENLRSENTESQGKLEQLSSEKDQLIKDYRAHKDTMDGAKRGIEKNMETYKELTKDTDEPPAQAKKVLHAIQEQKKILKDSNDRLKEIKEQLRQNQEHTKRLKDDVRTQQLLLSENSEFRKAIQEDERQKILKENASILDQERQKLRETLERDREEIIREAERRAAVNQGVSQEDVTTLQLELIKERAEKQLLKTRAELLERQIERLNQDFEANELEFQSEMEHQELHYLTVFKQYRSVFESEKRALERKLTRQVDSLAADAVYLANRNSELEAALDQLRQSVAKK